LVKVFLRAANPLENIMIRDLVEALIRTAQRLIFQGIEIPGTGEEKGDPKSGNCQKEYQQEKDSARKGTAEALRAKWQSLEEISGSAVVPKVAEKQRVGGYLEGLRLP